MKNPPTKRHYKIGSSTAHRLRDRKTKRLLAKARWQLIVEHFTNGTPIVDGEVVANITTARKARDDAKARLARGEYADFIAEKRREKGEIMPAAATAQNTPIAVTPGWLDARPSDRLADVAPRWLEARTSLKAKTVSGYRQMLHYCVLPTLGERPLEQLTVPVVLQALNRLFEEGYQIKTVRHAKATLSSLLTDAAGNGLIPVNPIRSLRVVQPSRPESKAEELARLKKQHGDGEARAEAWTQAQLTTFLTVNADEWYAPMFGVMAMCGLRRAEACGLRWPLVNLGAATLKVLETTVTVDGRAQADTPKNAPSLRTVPLRAQAAELLKLHQSRQAAARRQRQRKGLPWGDARGADFVFTRPDGVAPHPDSLRKLYRRLCERAGVPPLRIHDLRDTAATHLAQGLPIDVVAKILGHGSTATTYRYYRHVQVDELRAAVAKLPPLQRTPPEDESEV